MHAIEEIESMIGAFDPITLEEMKGVQMMNRTDTKYVIGLSSLIPLLKDAMADYRVQEVDGERLIGYHTVYYDTPDQAMYRAHQNKRKTREKIRLRTYVSSGLTFFEVKNKNNRGRTDKKRIKIALERTAFLNDEETRVFLKKHAWYTPEQLSPQLENEFRRITLVNRGMTERLTIDSGLKFHNLCNAQHASLEGIAIIELKRDGRTPSPMHDELMKRHIHTNSFSKYCMGYALTDPNIKQNLFKENIRWVIKLNQKEKL